MFTPFYNLLSNPLSKRALLIILLLMVTIGVFMAAPPSPEAQEPRSIQDNDQALSLKNCEGAASVEEQSACWSENLETTLKTHGLEAAFGLFLELYRSDSNIPKLCHDWTHILGEKAFELYEAKQSLILRKEIAYCSFGFFHGFIERMLQEHGNLEESYDFCKYATSLLKEEVPAIDGTCAHGIGHGVMATGLDQNPSLWGDLQAMIDFGTSHCKQVLDIPIYLQECYDGVFDELQSHIPGSEYGLSWREFTKLQDPFAYCHIQKQAHKEACYTQIISLFPILAERRLQNALNITQDHLSNIPPEYIPLIIEKMSGDFVFYTLAGYPDFQAHITACRSLDSNLFPHCISGILIGLFTHAEPEREHIKGLEICESDMLANEEQTFCYRKLAFHASAQYSLSHLERICLLFPKEYQDQCKPYYEQMMQTP